MPIPSFAQVALGFVENAFLLNGKGSESLVVYFIQDSIHLLLHKFAIVQIHGLARGRACPVSRLVHLEP